MYALYTHTRGKIVVVGYSDKPEAARGITIVKIKDKESFEESIKHRTEVTKGKVAVKKREDWRVEEMRHEDYLKIKSYTENEEWGKAYKMHNRLKLSELKYCCTRHIEKLKKGISDYGDYIKRRNRKR